MSTLTENTITGDILILSRFFNDEVAKQVYIGTGLGMIRQGRLTWLIYMRRLPFLPNIAMGFAYENVNLEVPISYDGFRLFSYLAANDLLPAEPYIQMLGRAMKQASVCDAISRRIKERVKEAALNYKFALRNALFKETRKYIPPFFDALAEIDGAINSTNIKLMLTLSSDLKSLAHEAWIPLEHVAVCQTMLQAVANAAGCFKLAKAETKVRVGRGLQASLQATLLPDGNRLLKLERDSQAVKEKLLDYLDPNYLEIRFPRVFAPDNGISFQI